MRTANSTQARYLHLLTQLADSETESWSRVNLTLARQYQLISTNLAIISTSELVTMISQATEVINETINITFQVLNEFMQLDAAAATLPTEQKPTRELCSIYIQIGSFHCETMCNWCTQFSNLVNRYRAQHEPIVPIPRNSRMATALHIYQPLPHYPAPLHLYRVHPYARPVSSTPIVVYQKPSSPRR